VIALVLALGCWLAAAPALGAEKTFAPVA